MSPILTLLLAGAVGWSPQGDLARDFAPIIAAILEIAEVRSAFSVSQESSSAAPTVCEVRYYFDAFAPQLADAPSVDIRSQITYDIALPIFRDKA